MNFNHELQQWYQLNKRDLPWRNTSDAYVIWLSEIILQQTRVEQGLPYFNRFVEQYPNVNEFANADEGAILKLWQGLGYYSRGRNMLKTAKVIRDSYNGRFPDSYDQLIKLKGIGEYTAAAIASFAANEAKAVVDGNVYRVLARYFGIDEPINSTKGKRTFQKLAESLINKQQPGLHNQAIMEFGAMLCRPKNPACGICPVKQACYAFLHNAVNSLPVKLNKIKVRERYFNYFLVLDGEKILLNKRNDKDIWANMYDLPAVESDALLHADEVVALPFLTEFFGTEVTITSISAPVKHLLTHQRLFVRFIKLNVLPVKMKETWFFASTENIKNLAMPKIIYIFIENILINNLFC